MIPGLMFISFIVIIVAVSFGIFPLFYSNERILCASKSQLNYWLIDSNRPNSSQNGSLETIKRVLSYVGHEAINGSTEEWDVMWSIAFPFELFPEQLVGLKPHQLINHFPAITFLTNKMFLSISTQSKYIPVAFEFPRFKNEFNYHCRLNPNKEFVVKNYDEGGIKVVPYEEIDFFLGNSQYMQEFISNPFLIDGHAFDIGVYVLITSINPLRIYRWKSDILLRFCADTYHPLDHEKVEKYVVDESHLPFWEISSLKNASDTFGFSAASALNHYLVKHGHDAERLWEEIDDAIVTITLSKVDRIIHYVNKFYKEHSDQKQTFFELLRYDFILDDKMNLHLMEVNMNPDLAPKNVKHERLSLMYEQLVYNTLSILGVTKHSEIKPSTTEESLMFSAPKDIAVSPDKCINCIESCEHPSCELCLPCLPDDTIQTLHQSYREHQRRGEMKRLFPSEIYNEEGFVKKLSEGSKLAMKWFKAKCDDDYDWC